MFSSQHPHRSSQPCVIPGPRFMMLSSGPCRDCIHGVHIQACMQNSHTYNIRINKFLCIIISKFQIKNSESHTKEKIIKANSLSTRDDFSRIQKSIRKINGLEFLQGAMWGTHLALLLEMCWGKTGENQVNKSQTRDWLQPFPFPVSEIYRLYLLISWPY